MSSKPFLAALALAVALFSPMALAQDAHATAEGAADRAAAQEVAPAQAEALPQAEAPPPDSAPAPVSDAADAPQRAEAAEPAAAAAPARAMAPMGGNLSDKVAAVVGTPPEGKAHVVFFRPSKFVGAAVGFKVRENEVELGKLRNGNYFVLAVDPGEHTFVVHSETKDVTPIEVEAGETYFLSGSISMGVMAGRPNLSPSDAAAFEAALPKLKPSKPLD